MTCTDVRRFLEATHDPDTTSATLLATVTIHITNCAACQAVIVDMACKLTPERQAYNLEVSKDLGERTDRLLREDPELAN